MISWLVAAFFGVGLGFGLYACVRLRMYIGPRVKAAYGLWPRRFVWIIIVLFMIGLGNAMLIGLRIYLDSLGGTQSSLMHELLFAGLALILGLTLVFARIHRKKR